MNDLTIPTGPGRWVPDEVPGQWSAGSIGQHAQLDPYGDDGLCHCGAPVDGTPDLGPAPMALCSRCLPLRCDAYPGSCDEPPIFPTLAELNALEPTGSPTIGPADLVNHPAHYTAHPSGIECIDVVEHMGFNLGCAVKYVWRADLKGDAIEDLKKARWYIDRELIKRGADA